MKKSTVKNQRKEETTFPVLKFDYNFNLIYSNQPAQTILNHWNISDDQKVPSDVLSYHPELNSSFQCHTAEDININVDNIIIRCSVVPFPEAGYIGVYGYMLEFAEKINERATVARLN